MATDGGSWTLINPNISPQWKKFFSSWAIYANNKVVGPNVAKMSCLSWKDWFSLDNAKTEFRRSPDCKKVSKIKNRIYRMTGNYYGCKWINVSCNLQGDTCRKCTYPGTKKTEPGTCPYLDASVYHGDNIRCTPTSQYCHSCSSDWWNNAPSLGNNGKHCVAYR